MIMHARNQIVYNLINADLDVANKETQLKSAKAAQKNLERELAETMDNEGLTEFTFEYELPDGNKKALKVTRDDEIYPQVAASEKEELHKWLFDIEQEELIKTSVHPKSLQSLVKKLIKNGESYPEFINIGHTEPKIKIKIGTKSFRIAENIYDEFTSE